MGPVRASTITVLLLTTMLAGCADDAPSDRPADDFSAELDQELQATADTGVIRGVVVDAAVVPVPGVTVTLEGTDASTETNDDGAFGFSGLEPGTYFMRFQKPGFFPLQQSASVEAGIDDPPVVRAQMERDLAFNPYSSVIQYTGFYQCGTSRLVVCGAPGILLELFGQDDPLGIDSSTNTFYFNDDLYFLQVEMVWDSTQAVSTELSYQVEALDDGCRPLEGLEGAEMGYAEGNSPIRARVDNATLEYYGVNPVDCGAYLSVFSGGAQGTPVGFSIEQEFEWFLTEFHGYAPPEDWWFINDGELAPPA